MATHLLFLMGLRRTLFWAHGNVVRKLCFQFDGADITSYYMAMNCIICIMQFRLLTGTICKTAMHLLFPMGLQRIFFWIHGRIVH